MKSSVVYYKDELNDEFSTAKITPRKIDGNFKYQKSSVWEFFSWLFQNVISMPIKIMYLKIKFHHKFVGIEKIKEYKKANKGMFIYSNHTQAFSDTFTPSLAVYPKRNFLIVNPENISVKGVGWLVEMLGAIPISNDVDGTKKFISRIENRIKKGYSVSIYPEAHIWPYCTWIRKFKAVSFKYPVKYDTAVFSVTNTYQKYKGNKIQMVSYIDGPFYAEKNLSIKEAQEKLRNEVYEAMCERAKNSNVEKIKYIAE